MVRRSVSFPAAALDFFLNAQATCWIAAFAEKKKKGGSDFRVTAIFGLLHAPGQRVSPLTPCFTAIRRSVCLLPLMRFSKTIATGKRKRKMLPNAR